VLLNLLATLPSGVTADETPGSVFYLSIFFIHIAGHPKKTGSMQGFSPEPFTLRHSCQAKAFSLDNTLSTIGFGTGKTARNAQVIANRAYTQVRPYG
jgi:hypothetical protein